MKVRDEAGGLIRVLYAPAVADLEDQGLLPDIYTMDDTVLYQAVYDERGVLEYALRYTSRPLVTRCRSFIADLYSRGEPIAGFFSREIADLPPPRPLAPAVPQDYLARTGRSRPIRS